MSRVKFALKDPEGKGRVKIKAMQGTYFVLVNREELVDSVRLVTSVNQSAVDSKSFISVSVNTAYPVLLA